MGYMILFGEWDPSHTQRCLVDVDRVFKHIFHYFADVRVVPEDYCTILFGVLLCTWAVSSGFVQQSPRPRGVGGGMDERIRPGPAAPR